jgi:REP element-mobilizing transposase RayT
MHLATSSDLPPGLEKRRAGTLSTIMGCFKSAVTRRINEKRNNPGATVWQSSFHDHIVRNREELHRIRRYIRTNPQQRSQSD